MSSKEKKLGELISNLNEQESKLHKVIETNIPSLDYILGGGIELGSKIQIVAEPSTGKTTISLQVCKQFCKKGYDVLYVDTENSVSEELLNSTGCKDFCNKEKGLKEGNLILIKESEFDVVSKKLDDFICLNRFELIVIDSLASLVNKCYTNIDSVKGVKEVTNNNTNYESRPLNLFINKYSTLAKKYNFAILYVNQFRNKIDMQKGTILKAYGNKIVHYDCDIKIIIKKDKTGYRADENRMLVSKSDLPYTHNKLILSLEKSNKLLTGTTVETYIKYGYGIDDNIDRILSLIRIGEIKKSGKYYMLYGNQSIDGFENLINAIYTDIDSFNNYYYEDVGTRVENKTVDDEVSSTVSDNLFEEENCGLFIDDDEEDDGLFTDDDE